MTLNSSFIFLCLASYAVKRANNRPHLLRQLTRLGKKSTEAFRTGPGSREAWEELCRREGQPAQPTILATHLHQQATHLRCLPVQLLPALPPLLALALWHRLTRASTSPTGPAHLPGVLPARQSKILSKPGPKANMNNPKALLCV